MGVEAYAFVRDNPEPLTENHAAWIKNDRPHTCRPAADNAKVRIRRK